MALSIDTIELALHTALTALQTTVTTGPTTTRPFAYVGRYVGAVPPEGIAEAAAAWPCALLRPDDEVSTRDVIGFGAASVEDRAVASFSVLVGVEDGRELEHGIVGDANVPGILRLLPFVIGACNALVIADTHMQLSVRYAGWRWELVRRGTAYVAAVRFEVVRDAELATYDASAAVTLTRVDSDLNIEGTGTPAPNPIVQTRSPTT